jgi:hypothetical protein
MSPHNEFEYHRQPLLFLSLVDTFAYIQKHDKQLMARVGIETEDEELKDLEGLQ